MLIPKSPSWVKHSAVAKACSPTVSLACDWLTSSFPSSSILVSAFSTLLLLTISTAVLRVRPLETDTHIHIYTHVHKHMPPPLCLALSVNTFSPSIETNSYICLASIRPLGNYLSLSARLPLYHPSICPSIQLSINQSMHPSIHLLSGYDIPISFFIHPSLLPSLIHPSTLHITH